MEPIECTGLWWLPGHEDNRVAGTLKISSSGNLHLSLIGAFGPRSTDLSKSLQIILGTVDKSPSGNEVTLTGCTLGGSSEGSSSFLRERYHASRGYFGAHLADESTFAFKHAAVRVGGLTEWARSLSGIVAGPASPSAEEKVSLGSYTKKSPLRGGVPGGTVLLHMGLGWTHSLDGLNIREKASVALTCDSSKSADEINSGFVYPLLNLMTFVCDRAQEVEWFEVTPEFADPRERADIQVIGPRVHPDSQDEGTKKEPVRKFEMLFTLKDIVFADFVGKWMRLTDRYSAACSIFFALKYGPPAYLDMTFTHVAQSLHLYHSHREDGLERRIDEERRLREVLAALPTTDAKWIVDHLGPRPYPTFEWTLRELVSEHSLAMSPLMSNRQDRFVTQVISTLHYLLHRESDADPATGHGGDLYWLMEKLQFLIKACFLAEAGFSEQSILTLLERNPLYQHMCKLESSRESGDGVLGKIQ